MTLAPTTGYGGVAESITRITIGWKLCPAFAICRIPETGCNCNEESGTAVALKTWHGVLFGATQTLTWTALDKALDWSVTAALPFASVCAVNALRFAVPRVI